MGLRLKHASISNAEGKVSGSKTVGNNPSESQKKKLFQKTNGIVLGTAPIKKLWTLVDLFPEENRKEVIYSILSVSLTIAIMGQIRVDLSREKKQIVDVFPSFL